MDSVLGLQGKDYALVAADCSAGRSIMVMKHDADKIVKLDDHKIAGIAGPQADAVMFSEYIGKNMALYAINNDMKLSTHATANYIRTELAGALRRGPYQTNILLGGYDADDGASLYFCDYMASLHKVPFGAHGYCSNFCLSIFDREWKADLTLEEGLEIVRKCKAELAARFLIAQPKFLVKIADADGVRTMEL